MVCPKLTSLLLAVMAINCISCTNTRYLTDNQSIKRQHEMRNNRSALNIADVLLGITNIFISSSLNTNIEIANSKRSFKKISIENESTDTLYVNMVTDIIWKENNYCDIMGIQLPPKAKQKLLVPYPAAYNVYFKTARTEEEKIEIRSDSKYRNFLLRPGMTNWSKDEKH